MRIDVLTLFPAMFSGPFDESIIKRAQDRGLAQVHLHNIRDFTHDRHHIVDDYPYGGGAGMVLKPEPVFEALQSVRSALVDVVPVVALMTPQGQRFEQSMAEELAKAPWLVLLCGHYEGVDERIRQHMVDREISVGDYVLTGGELPAMVVLDAVVRLIPGVMGSADSAGDESFSSGLLEYPHYTRPSDFMGWKTPDVLLSGHHAEVAKWRRRQALIRTAQRRPDLLAENPITAEEREWLAEALEEGQGLSPA
ncbi:MAG: tRNA (guanosine(37)-N1)-methyltransferase TrmD [Dehalococcoidia bacterium]|nr:tRNA (guanosine(37)-N1)-methyltransferase TrmD [Dehalococcoidia bacterium]